MEKGKSPNRATLEKTRFILKHFLATPSCIGEERKWVEEFLSGIYSDPRFLNWGTPCYFPSHAVLVASSCLNWHEDKTFDRRVEEFNKAYETNF